MRNITRLLITAAFAFLPVLASGQAKGKTSNEIQTVTFVTSMHCQNCVSTIMGSLPKEKGVKDVRCNLNTKQVTVQFQKGRTSTETIIRDFEKLGYTAKICERKDSTTGK